MPDIKTPQQIINEIAAAGINPSEIARRTNISQATICRIQQGNHKDPRNSTVDALRALHAEVLRAAAENEPQTSAA